MLLGCLLSVSLLVRAESTDGGARIERQLRAVDQLNAGALPEALSTQELFTIDLRDESAIAARMKQLSHELDGGVSGPLSVALARARLAFLRKPAVVRQALLAAEREANALERSTQALASEQDLASERRREAEVRQRDALEAVDAAAQAGTRMIGAERVKLETARLELARQNEQAANERGEFVKQQERIAARLFALKAASAGTVPAAEVDRVFDELVDLLVERRVALDEAVTAASKPFEQRPLVVDEALLATRGDDLDGERAAARELATTIQAEREASAIAERQRAVTQREIIEQQVEQLNDLRLAVLPRLSDEKHDAVLGFGPEGRAQLVRELTQLRVMSRWSWHSTGPELWRVVTSLSDPDRLASLIWRLVMLIVVAVLARFAVRRLPWARRALRSLPVQSLRRPALIRWATTGIDAVHAIAPELAVVVVMWAAIGLLSPTREQPYLLVPLTIAFDFSVYRLLIRCTHQIIAWLAKTPVGTLSEEKSERVLASVRLVGRYAFTLHVFFLVSLTLLGRGYLFSAVSRFAWLGAVPIAALLARWWDRDIATAYLKLRPEGAIATLVRKSADRPWEFVVGVVAFFFIFVAFIGRTVRAFVMRFDQTRKALAFVFRKRLERRAEDQVETVRAELPAHILEALTQERIAVSELLTSRLPKLADVRAAMAAWATAPTLSQSWLVSGKAGFGTTSWLRAAVDGLAETQLRWVSFTARPVSREHTIAVLAENLGLAATTTAQLIGLLRAAPPQVIVLDDLEQLTLRSVGARDAWACVADVIHGTGAHVFWLGACAHHAFDYLRWVDRGDGAFREIVTLSAWSERDIHALLTSRVERTGWHVSYDDLLVTRATDAGYSGQIVETSQEFTRLIWDYSEGSPRVALNCWAKSLEPIGPKLARVRLFNRPASDLLERLPELDRFLLAGITWHEALTVDDAIAALRLGAAPTLRALSRLVDWGVIDARRGAYRVSTEWWPVVERYLRSKHLIED